MRERIWGSYAMVTSFIWSFVTPFRPLASCMALRGKGRGRDGAAAGEGRSGAAYTQSHTLKHTLSFRHTLSVITLSLIHAYTLIQAYTDKTLNHLIQPNLFLCLQAILVYKSGISECDPSELVA